MIGWGSGISAGAALREPVRSLTAVEIEPAVIEASRQFTAANHDPLADPRLVLHEDDARHLLSASEATYDVVISEPSHPWVEGVSNLFTEDFFRLAARRLRPDGVFAQWVQMYQMSLDTYRAIVAAFQAVFPEVLVFVPPDTTDSILIGSFGPLRLDLARLDARWADPATRLEAARARLARPEDLLASLYLDAGAVRDLVAGGPVNTDDNMFVEFRGPRDLVRPLDEMRRETLGALTARAVAPGSVLTNPRDLESSPGRLRALIAALARAGRPTAPYDHLLARLGGSPPGVP
jgi:SAM-dependent methyltransferase